MQNPLPPSETPPPTPEQEANEAEQRQIRLAYGQFFGSENGKVILKDLMRRYGWDEFGVEKPCYVNGLPMESATVNDCRREPVRHILRMQNLPAKEAAKKLKRKPIETATT